MKEAIKKVMLVRLNSPLINKIKHPRSLRPPFTLKYMQALLLKRGIQVKLIDCAIEAIVLDRLAGLAIEWCPQLLVISESILEYELVIRFASQLKKRKQDILIIVVGQGVGEDFLKDPSCSCIDFALKGEAEIELVNLIDEIENGTKITDLKSRYREKLLNLTLTVEDLNGLPFPVYEQQELNRYSFVYPLKIYKRLKWGHILSSRGCPYECIFCSQTIRESFGKNIRLRSAKNVVDEIEALISRGANVIAFDDDNFTTVKEHVFSVCREIIERKISINWICHARVDNLTRDLLVLMKEAGCILLRCGIESGSERVLKILKKGGAPHWKEKAGEVFQEAKKLGILTNALFLIGNPTETVSDIEESIALAKQLAPDIIQVAFFTPYLGSPAYEEYRDKLTSVPLSQMYHYKPVMVNFSQVGAKELALLQRKLYGSILLTPEFILKHIRDYGLFYLFNHRVFFKLLRGAAGIDKQ